MLSRPSGPFGPSTWSWNQQDCTTPVLLGYMDTDGGLLGDTACLDSVFVQCVTLTTWHSVVTTSSLTMAHTVQLTLGAFTMLFYFTRPLQQFVTTPHQNNCPTMPHPHHTNSHTQKHASNVCMHTHTWSQGGRCATLCQESLPHIPHLWSFEPCRLRDRSFQKLMLCSGEQMLLAAECNPHAPCCIINLWLWGAMRDVPGIQEHHGSTTCFHAHAK